MEGALALRERLRAFTGGRVCLVVSRLPYKCPAAPYEGSLLVDDLLRERGLRGSAEIDVYTPESLPMPVAGPTVGHAVVEILRARGIGFHPNMELQGVVPERRELRFASGQRVPCDLLVAIPPHRPPRPVAAARLGEQGWVPVEPRTLRTKAERVWAVGDVTALRLANGLLLPKAAVFARDQAEVVARDVARHLGYDAPEPFFAGEGRCWLDVGGRQAAYAVGHFLEEPGPVVTLHGISPKHHAEKQEEERAWIRRWRGEDAGAG